MSLHVHCGMKLPGYGLTSGPEIYAYDGFIVRACDVRHESMEEASHHWMDAHHTMMNLVRTLLPERADQGQQVIWLACQCVWDEGDCNTVGDMEPYGTEPSRDHWSGVPLLGHVNADDARLITTEPFNP